jgi:exocyst complex component 4
MSVIRSLTASRDTEDRDREKANLQREYQESDRRLDKLVLQHHTDLTAVMHAFRQTSIRLESAKKRLNEIREKLGTCQSLLHCKKDELRRLWQESTENRHVLQLLQLVDEQAHVPDRVSEFVSGKRYLHATRLILSSLQVLDTKLAPVEALSEVKSSLIVKREEMFHVLMDELHRHIYVRSTSEVIKKLKKQELDRKSHAVSEAGAGSVSVSDMLSSAALRNPSTTTTSKLLLITA